MRLTRFSVFFVAVALSALSACGSETDSTTTTPPQTHIPEEPEALPYEVGYEHGESRRNDHEFQPDEDLDYFSTERSLNLSSIQSRMRNHCKEFAEAEFSTAVDQEEFRSGCLDGIKGNPPRPDSS